MAKNRALAEAKSIHVGTDGELSAGKFCAYCGNLNQGDADYCQHCGEFIFDQGPDLSSRLARIKRRASSARSQDAPLIGVIPVDKVERVEEPAIALDQVAIRLITVLISAYQRVSNSWLWVVINILTVSLEVLILYALVRYRFLPFLWH
jgi:hypothetical protein